MTGIFVLWQQYKIVLYGGKAIVQEGELMAYQGKWFYEKRKCFSLV